MVRYREIRPCPRLQPFIDSFWLLEHDGEDATPQRVVPDGRTELILNYSQPFEAFQDGRWQVQPRCFLAGQIDGPLLLRPKVAGRMLGVRFHPDGAGAVLACPMHELSARFTPIEAISPALSRDIDRALESAAPIAALETALAGPPAGDPLIAEAIRQIDLARGGLDLGRLARALGISIRQMERRFHTAVGLRPKLYCRIRRFNSVFRRLGEPIPSWVETAIACGYYDQAHLIRDCKSLSGNTPAVLLAAEGDLARHFYFRRRVSHSYNTARHASV